MPRAADEPLRRCTLNLFEADCLWLESTYGPGWTTRIRQVIRMEVYNRQYEGRTMKDVPFVVTRRTLGDLE